MTDTRAEADAQTITLDISSLTLGEMAEAEAETGKSFDTILTAGRATRRLLALWVHEQRTSAQPRSWQELSNLRLSDVSSSTSPSPSDGPSETSNV